MHACNLKWIRDAASGYQIPKGYRRSRRDRDGCSISIYCCLEYIVNS